MKKSKYFALISLFTLCIPSALFGSVHKVTTQPIQSLMFYPQQAVSASVISNHDATISAQTRGEISKLHYEVGDHVKQGQTIASLKCDDQQISVASAQSAIAGSRAKIDFYEWQLKQIQTLANQNHTSQERVKTYESELKFYQANLKAQETQLRAAKLDAQRCEIKAPFSGIITTKHAHLGEYVNQGTPVVGLQSDESLQVQAHVHPEQAEILAFAKQIVFQTGDETYPLRLQSQVKSLNKRTHTQEVRLSFIHQHPLPGSLGRVVWQDKRPHLPSDYVSQRGDQLGVFLSINQTAKFVPLSKAQEGRPVVLPTNLIGQVVIDGRHQLEDGFELDMINPMDDTNATA